MTLMAIVIIVISAILKFLMSPPSAVVGWVVSKFELHPKLDDAKEDIVKVRIYSSCDSGKINK